MKYILLICLFVSSFASAEELSCSDYGTMRDPYMQQATAPQKPYNRAEEIAISEQRIKDATRCKDKNEIQLQRNLLRIYREEEQREQSPSVAVQVETREESMGSMGDLQTAALGTPAKRIQITCEYGVKKPVQIFKLEGVEDTEGLVVAKGYYEDVAVELKFSNRDLSLGRTLKVSIGNASFDKFLRPGHGPIEYKSGMLSNAMGVKGKYKVKCYPDKQTYISQPQDSASAGTEESAPAN